MQIIFFYRDDGCFDVEMSNSKTDSYTYDTAAWTDIESDYKENFTIIYAHFVSSVASPVPQISNAEMHLNGY